ncbi:MAG: undecaprenyl-diphosphate phosphatase [Actinomycetes bacterium]
MSWLEAIVLGVVQGLTEFLPISSSAHLSIVGQLFGGDDPGAAFTAISQLGTEAAVLAYFWRDIVRIVTRWCLALVGKAPRDDPDARMGWLVIVGSIPISGLGFVLQDFVEGPLRNLWITATMLLVFALVIGWADSHARNKLTLDELTWRDGVLYGLAQSLALVPGVSRSGGTIAAGLLMGYTREAAARYSFLLAIPAVLGSGFFQVAKLSGAARSPASSGQIALATVIAFLIGYAVIAWLLRYISTHDFKPFVVYRIALALALFGLLGAGVLHAR